MDMEQDGARVQVLSEEQEYEATAATGAEGAPRPFRALHRMLRRGDYIGTRCEPDGLAGGLTTTPPPPQPSGAFRARAGREN